MAEVIAIQGLPGSGKSSLAATIPGRKFWFDLELGASRATWRISPDEYVTWSVPPVLDWLTYSKGNRIMGRKEQWTAIVMKYVEVLRDDSYSVVVFDTAKELWDIANQAILQEHQEEQLEKEYAIAINPGPGQGQKFTGTWQEYLLSDRVEKIRLKPSLMPREYAPANTRMANLINTSKAYNKTIVLINHITPKWVTVTENGRVVDKPTGEYEADEWSRTQNLADWTLQTSREDVFVNNNNGKAEKHFKFHARVIKSPKGADIVGVDITGAGIDSGPSFVQLTNLVAAMRA